MYFLFDPNRIISEVFTLKRIAKKLSASVDDVKSVESALDSDTYQTVLDRLKIYENNLDVAGTRMDGLSQGLSLIRDDYFNTENMICGRDGAPDWLKLIGEGKEAVIEWLQGLFGNGNSSSTVPWIVAMGGHSISLLSHLSNLFPFSESENGFYGLYAMGDQGTRSTGDIFGLGEISGSAGWHLLHLTESENAGYLWNMDENNMYGAFNERLGFSVLDGSASANFFGAGSLAASGGLLNANVGANGGVSMFVDGEYDPGIYGNVSADASVLIGSVSGQLGNDNNIHVGATGSVLSAQAGASGGIGRIVTDDGDVVHGISGNVGAGAAIAQGELSGGIDIWGLKIDAGVSAGYGSVGFNLGGELTTGTAGVNLDAAWIGKLGFRVKIDWTDFEIPDIDWPDIDWPDIDIDDYIPDIDWPDWLSW